jgi:uncharacterized protein YqeY
MNLRDRINIDLTAAMKAQQADRLAVLRMMKAAVKNKEIDARRELDDAGVVQVLSTLIKQRKESIEQFTRGGRADLADKEAAEIRVIESYLPASVPDTEIAEMVADVIRATGASSPKDMGAVMKECMARFAGKRVDGARVSAEVRHRLTSL